MQLIAPSVKYQQSYLEAIEEGRGELNTALPSEPKSGESFDEFVKNKMEEAQGLHLPDGFVPNTELWLVDNGEFIGRTGIRHYLNDHLLKVGGHIGYWIRPTKRKMGYGKMILKLGLIEAKKLGIKDILVTCDVTNIASKNVIEANGGILENIVPNGENNPLKMRYWITPCHNGEEIT